MPGESECLNTDVQIDAGIFKIPAYFGNLRPHSTLPQSRVPEGKPETFGDAGGDQESCRADKVPEIMLHADFKCYRQPWDLTKRFQSL